MPSAFRTCFQTLRVSELQGGIWGPVVAMACLRGVPPCAANAEGESVGTGKATWALASAVPLRVQGPTVSGVPHGALQEEVALDVRRSFLASGRRVKEQRAGLQTGRLYLCPLSGSLAACEGHLGPWRWNSLSAGSHRLVGRLSLLAFDGFSMHFLTFKI